MPNEDSQPSASAVGTAETPGPSRRDFLRRGSALGFGALMGREALAEPFDRPPWMRMPGQGFSNYGQPSSHEQALIRWIAGNPGAPGNGISWTPLHKLAGTLTPSGLHFERHHNGVPQIDPAAHRLLIHGLVKHPIFLSLEQLRQYPQVSRTCFIECGGNSNAGWHQEPLQAEAGNVHGLVSASEWTGVPLAVVLEEAGLQGEARWLIAEGADAAAMHVSIPVSKALDDTILALYQNGEAVRPENGYPLRMIVPGWEGVVNVKWLRRLELSSQPAMARNETAKYTELQPDGKARQFTFVMEAKSLITQPSIGYRLGAPGLKQISGLAWSGRGKISRVEVSTDGGKSWLDARLQEPVLSKSFTRFSLPWRWQGEAAVVQSRATDETGYRQPARAELVEKRGSNGYFHYNAVVSWAVSPDGSISHVYP
jgi:sulfane dehydrogenase subunit SoxC